MVNAYINEFKVSIIVPVYNVEKYLKDCIDSILNQTYQNFELILVNDGSTDSSGDICDQYKKFDRRITVVHQSNKGQSVARNIGVNLSKTEWVLFIDSDDLIHPQMLEFLVRAVLETNANMSVCGRLQEVSIPNNFYEKREFKYTLLDINESTLLRMYKSKDICLNDTYWLIYPKLIKKTIVNKFPFFEGKIFEDNEVSCKWLIESCKVVVLSEYMYFYTTNPTGTMQSKFSKKKLDYFWALESKIQFYQSIGYKRMVREIANDLLETAFYYYNISINENNKEIEAIVKKKIKKILKTYKEYLMVDRRIKDKLLKIYHPYVYKIKKRFLK